VHADRRALLQARAESDEERALEFKKNFAPEKLYSDYAELLGDAEVDAAVICLPNFLHFPATFAALAPVNTSFAKNRRP
jgi:predicted dehydrogenase